MRYLLAGCFLLMASVICAQNISGRVFNDALAPVANATVALLLEKDSSEVSAVITDEEGAFMFTKQSNNNYLIKVTAVDHIPFYSAAFIINNSHYDVPTVILVKNNSVLSAITVTAKRSPVEVKAGKTVVNVEASPTNAGLNALELLEKSPGVSVDNDGNISLKGKGGVLVLIDGKQTYLSGQNLASFLKSLQAGGINQIEIMTNPPAKYDATGGAGIINITTKKGTVRGMNGNMNLNYSQGFYPKYNGGANFNYRNQKINLFGGYNGGVWEGIGTLNIDRNFYKEEVLSGTARQTTLRHNKASWHNVKLGADYNFTEKDVVGVVINSNLNPWKNWQQSTSFLNDANHLVTNTFVSDAYNANNEKNITTNLNYKHSFDSTGREISSDLDYGYYYSKGKNTLNTRVMDAGNVQKGNTIILDGLFPSATHLYTAKVDYVHPFSKAMKLETGVKTAFVSINNDVIYQRDTSTGWFADAERSNHFIYKENVNAVYAIFSAGIKKWELNGGLRVENTNVDGRQIKGDTRFKRHYTSLFPNASVSYNMNDKNQWALSYSRRIRRPDYSSLNPFVFFIDSLTYGQGNPYLQPQFSNNIELSHTFYRFLTTTVNYTRNDDVITQILKQDTERKTMFQTMENLASMQQWGVTVTANRQIIPWWTINVYANFFSNFYKGMYVDGTKNYPITQQATGFLGNMTNSFNFAKTFTAEVSGWYTNRISEGLLIGGNMGALNLALAKQIFNKNGTIKIGVRDVFRTQNFNGYSRYADVDVSVVNDRRKDNRVFVVSFTYKFGKNNIAPERRRSGGAADEQSRIKSGGN